jgi:hypothetical protein
MDPQTIVFWFIFDPITFGIGSIGAYIIFRELSDLDHFPSMSDMIQLLRKHWLAFLFLAIAIGYFFYRLVSVLQFAGGTSQ